MAYMKGHNTLILGLGNMLRGDDAVGIYVTMALEKKLEDGATVVCTEEMGLSLLDHLSGFDEAIIIDSISTAAQEMGKVHLLSLADFASNGHRSNHYIGLPEAALLAQRLALPFPETVHIIGVEVVNPYTISTSLSLPMQRRLPGILKEVEDTVRGILTTGEGVDVL